MIPGLLRSLDRTVAFIRDSVADLSEDDMVLQPAGAPNHPAWTLGHVIHSFEAIAGEVGVKPWLPEQWASHILPTKGHAAVHVIAAHTAFHAGQLAAWRRAVGRKPAAVFE